MNKLNLLFFLNAYADAASSNNPSQNYFKWTRNLNGISIDNPIETTLALAPGESRVLFDGTRTLAQDGTTQYSIALAPLQTSQYVLNAVAGTLPNFRTPRTVTADMTTSVVVRLNGTVATFAGTNLTLAGVQVGDNVVIGSDFNSLNQGQFVIIATSGNSFSVVNAAAVPETVSFTVSPATQLQIFSAAGVQPGDTLVIGAGFSLVTQGSYVVSSVTAQTITFFSAAVLPQEGPITTMAISAYESAKRLVFIETDQICSILVNSAAAGTVEPMIQGNVKCPGIYFSTTTAWALSITNNSASPANVHLIAAE